MTELHSDNDPEHPQMSTQMRIYVVYLLLGMLCGALWGIALGYWLWAVP